MVVDIDGIISPLSITFEGWFTINFNRNKEEKKRRGETFVTNKWFKSYGYNNRALTVLWETIVKSIIFSSEVTLDNTQYIPTHIFEEKKKIEILHITSFVSIYAVLNVQSHKLYSRNHNVLKVHS